MNPPNELVTDSDTVFPKLYVVVCIDMHVAYGPYADPREALFKAGRLTSKSDCKYVPVLLQFDPSSQGVMTGIGSFADRGEKPDWRGQHGYL